MMKPLCLMISSIKRSIPIGVLLISCYK
ncbi:hypothetical protein Golob_021844 [Gossypium lobatum]|uniref:Uncharacterized protein n=1 Tax=Gossypium lobatum TaxID=34289 RepID=A0A7J8LER2_9ROSI|nr:hypothetical protein [Gossypium lobatum]